jgi:hypothetical protein
MSPRSVTGRPLAFSAQKRYPVSPGPAQPDLFEFVPVALAHVYPTQPSGTLSEREDYGNDAGRDLPPGQVSAVKGQGSTARP